MVRGGRSQPHPLPACIRQQKDVHNLDAADTDDRVFRNVKQLYTLQLKLRMGLKSWITINNFLFVCSVVSKQIVHQHLHKYPP